MFSIDFRAVMNDEQKKLPVRCDNCSWRGHAQDTHPIHDLEDRIGPGGEVPVGECPKCGVLTYLFGQNKDAGLVEDVAAVSGEFHGHARYKEFYERYCDTLSGFPGIWKFAALAGQRFNVVAKSMKVVWGESHDWVESVDAYVADIYRKTLLRMACGVATLQSDAWLDVVAGSNIRAITDTATRDGGAGQRKPGLTWGDVRKAAENLPDDAPVFNDVVTGPDEYTVNVVGVEGGTPKNWAKTAGGKDCPPALWIHTEIVDMEGGGEEEVGHE